MLLDNCVHLVTRRFPLARRRRKAAAASALALALVIMAAAAAGADTRPVTDLRGATDIDLQTGLERVVRAHGLWPQVEAKRLALGLVDITDIEQPHSAMLNPDLMVYAASLPKIAILLGAFVAIEAGDLVPDARLREAMTQMIRVSSNADATYVLGRVGRQKLLDILTSDRLRLYHPDFNGGLWVGKDYARGAAYARDPLHGLSHGATVRQVARFFYLLERGDLVGEPYRTEMKNILADPDIEHKFVAGLRDRPAARLHRKSGTWRQFHADAALVEAGSFRYIIVGLARHEDGGQWLRKLATPMHDLLLGMHEPPFPHDG